ncbi:MAG TPA: isoamylase early set domain-containing protein [Gemmatimonas sp.]|uniref:isoamylase early set domain-containing protein n=1 Tax=Gemmatimonas sp. TaxID=1962908 RepID=UPI002ED9F9B7
MADPIEFPFGRPTDEPDFSDAEVMTRLRASYRALPTPPLAQVQQCAAAVLARAGASGAAAPVSRSVGRTFRPQWWWGAAAAATLVVGVMRPWRGEKTQHEADSAFAAGAAAQPTGSTRDEGDGEIRFDLTLPSTANAVAIVGDFNGWDETKTPMAKRGRDGTWSVRVPLSPGRYTYAFVVDGREWLVDALAPQVPDAGFGPANAVIVDGED